MSMTTDDVEAVTLHPAKYPKAILRCIGDAVQREGDIRQAPMRILDPFAGTGRIHDLATTQGLHTVGVEIEPEWAACHPDTVCGDALELVDMFGPEAFDGCATSQCYGNRMADHHDACDDCKTCAGKGRVIVDGEARTCSQCRGKGLSKRNTYTHTMQAATGDRGRKLAPTNAGTLAWGKEYRTFHEAVFRQMVAVTKPGGFAILNVSNHYATVKGRRVEHRVAEWTLNCWTVTIGCFVTAVHRVETARNRQGANYDARVDGELVMVFRLPDDPQRAML